MALKSHAFLLYFPRPGQRINLITAAVGQNWPGPAVEFMQPARRFDDLEAGAEVQMIGVPQNNLRRNILPQLVLMDCFYRASRADGHENGRADFTMIGLDEARAGAGVRVCFFNLKFHRRKIGLDFCFFWKKYTGLVFKKKKRPATFCPGPSQFCGQIFLKK